MKSNAKVAILVCTYNGEKYISEQLDSIISQSYNNWEIFVSDDGSNDNTINILKQYQEKVGADKFHLTHGPQQGFAWNFLSLLKLSGNNFDYYAFSDQDDIWLSNKLITAINAMSGISNDIPSLYCGRTKLINEVGEDIGYSPLFKKKPSFCNALVQSIAGGNTMVINQSSRRLIIKTPMDAEVVAHDWWVYILVSACGGSVYYDAEPMILYRQHDHNIIGANTSLTARLLRVMKLLDGQFQQWISSNLNLLDVYSNQLQENNKLILLEFIELRNTNIFNKFRIMHRTKLYRQTFIGNIALVLAMILNKI